MKRLLLLAAGLFNLVQAQVQIAGLWQHSTFGDITEELKVRYMLPPIDNTKVLAKELMTQQAGGVKPYKFGEAVPFALSIKTDGEWSVHNAGTARIWRAIIHSPGAQSLSILFDDFFLPTNSELYIIGQNVTLGAFTGRLNNKQDGTFSTTPIPGDMIILEYVEPIPEMIDVTTMKMESENAKLHVGTVVHGFRKSLLDYQDAGRCNIDVACPDGNKYRDLINSVGIFLTDHGQRFCTGTVINNPRQDGRQLFLTANHCVFQDTTRFIVGFNYQNKACVSSGAPKPQTQPGMQTVQGMKLLGKWDKSDWALFEILENIPDSYNVFYAGWSREKVAPRDCVGIHHPSGDVKKISLFTGQTVAGSWQELPNRFHWMIPSWTRGITEPGSSGSALFDSKGRVVGHLHGGQSSCEMPHGYDLYGALSADWESAPAISNQIKQHLDPDSKRVLSMGGSYYTSSRKGPALFENHSVLSLSSSSSNAQIDNAIGIDNNIASSTPPEIIYESN